MGGKAATPRISKRLQSKFCQGLFILDMDMRRFLIFITIKEKTVTADSQYSGYFSNTGFTKHLQPALQTRFDKLIQRAVQHRLGVTSFDIGT